MTTRVQGLSGYVWIACACGKEVQRHADLSDSEDGDAFCRECRRVPVPHRCGEPVWDAARPTTGGWSRCTQDRAHTGRCTP